VNRAHRFDQTHTYEEDRHYTNSTNIAPTHRFANTPTLHRSVPYIVEWNIVIVLCIRMKSPPSDVVQHLF
jgi:hypothetical protein